MAADRLGRFPGDPPDGDRTFGPLGGVVDDVYFWQKSRDRAREVESERLASAGRAPGRGFVLAVRRLLRLAHDGE